MRQTQIRRAHKRRAPADPALVELPTAPISNTSAATAIVDAIDALIDVAATD